MIREVAAPAVARGAGISARLGRAAYPAINWPRVGLITLFGVIVAGRITFLIYQRSPFFTEPLIDIGAARVWLAGGDPWAAPVAFRASFGGPPTMLLPYAPLTLLDPFVARFVVGSLSIAAAFWALRRLQLPVWWMLWPPLFEAVVHASFDSFIPILLLTAGGPLAAFVKPYAAAGLITRPRALVVTAVLVGATVPVLPWSTFLADLPVISATLASQASQGGLSAYGNWLAMAAVAIALISIGPRRGGMLAPAGLWPFAQLHYGAMAVSVAARAPLLAAFMAIPVPGAAPAGIIAFAILERLRRAT